jgi:hypothetical protein
MSETSNSTVTTSTGKWNETETRILTEAIAAERAAKNNGVNKRGLARSLVAGELGRTHSYAAIYAAIRRNVKVATPATV